MPDEPPPDQQLTRAVANALWWYLQRDAWTPHRQVRAISATGNPQGHNYAPGAIPGPTPTVELISITWQIRTWLWSDQWPGRACYAIELKRQAHNEALANLPHAAIAELDAAYESPMRRPFRVDTDQDGRRYLTRNREAEAMTHLVAGALEAIASRASLELIPEHVERALITDEDQIRPAELYAALRHDGGAGDAIGPNLIEATDSL